jgi:hypothetical protein
VEKPSPENDKAGSEQQPLLRKRKDEDSGVWRFTV